MKELRFESGVETYRLNDRFTLCFNPTDSAFTERLFSAFDNLDEKQAAYQAEADALSDGKELFALARRRDAEMRALLDGALGEGCCEAVFGGMNVYALAGGLPVWANLLLAVIDEMDTAFAREQKATNPRLEVYLKKYRR